MEVQLYSGVQMLVGVWLTHCLRWWGCHGAVWCRHCMWWFVKQWCPCRQQVAAAWAAPLPERSPKPAAVVCINQDPQHACTASAGGGSVSLSVCLHASLMDRSRGACYCQICCANLAFGNLCMRLVDEYLGIVLSTSQCQQLKATGCQVTSSSWGKEGRHCPGHAGGRGNAGVHHQDSSGLGARQSLCGDRLITFSNPGPVYVVPSSCWVCRGVPAQAECLLSTAQFVPTRTGVIGVS